MASNCTGNWNFGRNQQPTITREAGVNNHSNRRPDMGTGSRYTHLKIANDKGQDVNKLFEALAVLQRINMEEITPLLLKNVTATATNRLFKKDNEVQWAERIDWQMEHGNLEIRYNEFEHKMATLNPTVANELEKQRRMLKKTEQEMLEQTNEMSRLNIHVELVQEESKFLKAQLQDKEMQLLKQKQERYLNMEYEQLQMQLQDLQRKLDKIEHESQEMAMNKTKVENENKKLSDMLRKTEHEFSEQTIEVSRLKKRVESVDEESMSLKKRLQEKEMQLLKQKQGKSLNVEKQQFEMRQKDLQQKFDKINDEYQSMAMDKTKLEKENEKLRSTLSKMEEEFSEQKSEIPRLKRLVDLVNEELKALKAQMRDKEAELLKQKQRRDFNVENEQLEETHKDFQRKFDKIKDDSQAMIMDKSRLENGNENLSAMLKKSGQESLDQKSEISRLKKRIEKMDQESVSFKAHLQEKERQLQEQKLATKKAYAEKDDALTRLSRHMGQQMSEGNPNITDLSDKNRPSKLGERYSELYDNEWTDAFECLTEKFCKDIDDKSAIEILRKILLESYKSAFNFSLSQMKEAEYKLSGSSKEVSPECKRLLKEARKHVDIKRADSLLENVLEGSLRKVIDRRYLNETMVQVFATECVQLCWLMAIQDPPVVLAEDPVHGSRFDTNIYKHYTNSGDTFAYVVWPALLLYKGGPLLTKGVAQPFPRPSQKSASALGENKITEYGMFDKKSQSLFGNKVQAVTSNQGDYSSWRNLEYNRTPTGTFSSHGNATQNQRLAGNATHLHLNQVLLNDQEKEMFKLFCSYYPLYEESYLRQIFRSDFQRYYELYKLIHSGDDSYA